MLESVLFSFNRLGDSVVGFFTNVNLIHAKLHLRDSYPMRFGQTDLVVKTYWTLLFLVIMMEFPCPPKANKEN